MYMYVCVYIHIYIWSIYPTYITIIAPSYPHFHLCWIYPQLLGTISPIYCGKANAVTIPMSQALGGLTQSHFYIYGLDGLSAIPSFPTLFPILSEFSLIWDGFSC